MRTDLVTSGCDGRGDARCVTLHADRGCQYTSAQLARFADEHNLTRSVARTAVCWNNTSGRIILGHNEIGFYDRYLWRPPARRLSALSAIDRGESTTGAGATRPSTSSARSNTSTDSFRGYKPPRPVSAKRGQGQEVG
jgi:transposase InsO family protein